MIDRGSKPNALKIMFLLNLFKSRKLEVSAAPVGNKQAHRFDAIRSAADLNRKPVGVVLRDTLRVFGMPPDMIESDVFAVRREDREEVHVHFVIKKWSDPLLRYEWALEKKLLSALQKNEPLNNPSKFVISWRFGPDCQCPFPEMPDRGSWKPRPAPAPIDTKKDIMDRRAAPRAPREPVDVRSAPKPEEAASFARTALAPLE